MSNPWSRRYGRFHVVRGESPDVPPIHARIQEGDTVEFIVGASAFCGALCEDNMFVVGMEKPPSPDLASVFLAAPGSIARLVAHKVSQDMSHFVELSCWDEYNFESKMVIGVKLMDANLVISDALRGLLAALAGMESVLEDVEIERTANANQSEISNDSKAMDSGGLSRLYRPTLVKGKTLQSHPAYKKAVLSDVADIGNRAYHQAIEASSVRDAVMAQREKRRQTERRARTIKRERRQSILNPANALKSSVVSRISFFDDEPKDEDATCRARQAMPVATSPMPSAPMEELAVHPNDGISLGSNIGNATEPSTGASGKVTTPAWGGTVVKAEVPLQTPKSQQPVTGPSDGETLRIQKPEVAPKDRKTPRRRKKQRLI